VKPWSHGTDGVGFAGVAPANKEGMTTGNCDSNAGLNLEFQTRHLNLSLAKGGNLQSRPRTGINPTIPLDRSCDQHCSRRDGSQRLAGITRQTVCGEYPQQRTASRGVDVPQLFGIITIDSGWLYAAWDVVSL